MNRSPDHFIKEFESAAQAKGIAIQPFEPLWPPYPTHINTHMEASWIDNIFIAIPTHYKTATQATVTSDPADIFPGLQETVDLLEEMSSTEKREIGHNEVN